MGYVPNMKQLFVAGAVGLASLSPFAAAAQTITERQCLAAQMEFIAHARANADRFSNEDRAEFRKLNAWFGGGCPGTITLQARPRVRSMVTSIGLVLNANPNSSIAFNLGQVIRYEPARSSAPAASTIQREVRHGFCSKHEAACRCRFRWPCRLNTMGCRRAASDWNYTCTMCCRANRIYWLYTR